MSNTEQDDPLTLTLQDDECENYTLEVYEDEGRVGITMENPWGIQTIVLTDEQARQLVEAVSLILEMYSI